MMWKWCGILGIDWRFQTLKSAFVMYQSYLLHSWDHTAHISQAIIFAASDGKKSIPLSHPYRKREQQGERVAVETKTFGILDRIIAMEEMQSL